MKAIAVIIPIYNMEKYLEKCLVSVIEQSLQNIEVICINDGSSDNSLEVLKEYQKKDLRIKVISQENQGVSVSRNIGIDLSDAEYVCFIDPDDYYPDAHVLEDLYIGAKEQNVKICGGSFSHYDERNKTIKTVFMDSLEKYTFPQNKLMGYNEYQFDYGYHRFIYLREMLIDNKIYFPSYKRFQDPPFFTQAMIVAERFYALSRITYQYRIGHQNINWDEERVLALIGGICNNLRISAKYELPYLHAITIQRIIEHKKAFKSVSLCSASIEYKRCLFNLVFDINYELLMKSNYGINIDELFQTLNSVFYEVDLLKQETDKWREQYECIANSKTLKLGSLITYLPRKIVCRFRK